MRVGRLEGLGVQIGFDNLADNPTVGTGLGVVAQLVEHHNGIVGVWGSNPHGSTKPQKELKGIADYQKPRLRGTSE
jgi:hypothetical protein